MIKLFLGVPGAGKTQAMIDFVRMSSDAHKFFVVDRANEWLADGPRWRGEPVNRIAVAPGTKPEAFAHPGVYSISNLSHERCNVARFPRVTEAIHGGEPHLLARQFVS
jgi:hypothetical protein